MSRQKNTLQLPHSLQKELGLERSKKSRRQNGVQDRKEQRRNRRVEKKQFARQSDWRRKSAVGRDRAVQEALEDDEEAAPFSDENNVAEAKPSKTRDQTHLRPLPKRPPPVVMPADDISDSGEDDSDPDEEEGEHERLYRGSTPEIVLDAGSRSYKDRLAEDDDEIAALEKRLGLKGKKSNGRDDDGLGDLLGEANEDTEDRGKRKREGDDWLRAKRRKAEALREPQSTLQPEESGSRSDLDDTELSDLDGDDISDGSDNGEDQFGGFDDDDEEEAAPRRIRENPYVAPVAPSPGKYVPPSLRKTKGTPNEALQRLRRQLQGHLNKLSESNIISIVNEIDKLYSLNPRGDVTTTLIDLLLNLFTSASTLSNTFTILHAAFATAIYRLVGVDFGAQLLESLVTRFFSYHASRSTSSSGTPKEALNLLSLLSNLFTFSLTSAPLILSLTTYLLTPLSEPNAELLLRLLRDCGPQLRTADPGALKRIAALTTSALADLPIPSVRTKFTVETITALAANKSRSGTSNLQSTADAGASREHITRLRKALGSLTSSGRTLRATEPLRIDLSDILNADKKGKWWLVGASWKGNGTVTALTPDPDSDTRSPSEHLSGPTSHPQNSTEPDLPSIARSLHLTTPLQHLIFTTIALSPSVNLAHERLLKLNLKNAQLPELPRVVVRCCGAEEGYNEFYAQLAIRLCTLGNKAGRIAKGFVFAGWGVLRRVGAGGDDEEEGGRGGTGLENAEDVSLVEVNNTARMYAALVHYGSVDLGMLRTVDLHLLKEDSKAQLWVEVLLVRVLVACEAKEGEVAKVFGKLVKAMHVVPRLRVFMKRFVRRSRLVEGGEEKGWVKRGCKIAERVCDELGRAGGEGEGEA